MHLSTSGGKPSRTLWGSRVQILSVSYPTHRFLFVGNRYIQPPRPFRSSKGQIQTAANQRREGTQEEGRSSEETVVQSWGRVLVPAQGIYLIISLSSSAGNKVGNKVENGNFMLSTGFLGHYPVTLPLTSQQKVYTQWNIINTLISS